MANAALAGGVAIGSTCNIVGPVGAFCIGLLAGAISVLGFVFVQPMLESKFKTVDTCGVHNLHGLPGLLGGLSAIVIVPGITVAQFTGIGITLTLAIVGGVIAGSLIKMTGTTKQAYEDSHEFTHLECSESEHKIEELVLEAKASLQDLKNQLGTRFAASQTKSERQEPGSIM